MSKAIQKPSQFAAVENAARVMDNPSETAVQAGCVIIQEPLLAGCIADGVNTVQASSREDELLAGCAFDGVPGIESEK